MYVYIYISSTTLTSAYKTPIMQAAPKSILMTHISTKKNTSISRKKMITSFALKTSLEKLSYKKKPTILQQNYDMVLAQQSSFHTGSEQFPVEKGLIYPCVKYPYLEVAFSTRKLG